MRMEMSRKWSVIIITEASWTRTSFVNCTRALDSDDNDDELFHWLGSMSRDFDDNELDVDENDDDFDYDTDDLE